MIGAIVLAAGEASRFGAEKILARYRGIELVRHVVDRLATVGLEDIVVVVPPAFEAIGAALAGTAARLVINSDPEDGMSGSIRVGVDELSTECSAFFVAHADQPLLDVDVLRDLRDTWDTSNAAAIVPLYRGVKGNPVLFDATMRRALRDLEGDKGARELLDSMGERVGYLPVDADAPADVDTVEDLESLED